MSVDLTKAIAAGYYLHDYSGWNLEREYEEDGNQIIEYRIHIGYGIYLDCVISIDNVSDKSVSFRYTLRGNQWGKERASNSFIIENISILIDDSEIVMPHGSYLVTIKHEGFDITEYLKENAMSVKEKYRIKGDDMENEVRYRMPKHPPAEYAGLPAYEFETATISDEVLDRLLRAFEFGDASALGPLKKKGENMFEGELDIVAGYRLRYLSNEPDIYLDDMEYVLDWASPDGDYGISAIIDHLTSKNHAFRLYGHRSMFDLYAGCARIEYYFQAWHHRNS